MGATAAPSISWELANQNAANWARQHAAELVSRITDTSRERIRQAVADWTQAAEGLNELTKQINQIVNDPARARTIAVTEATTTYAEANAQAWVAAGYAASVYKPAAHPHCRCYIQPAKLLDGTRVIVWYTARDELVCVKPLQTPWGQVEGCRGLHKTIISEGPHLGQKL